MIDFFVELFLAEDKLKYVRHRWFFLLLSIPYLNIINLWHVEFSAEALYFIRFIPLARGALALAIVIGYMTDNALSSLLLSYISITLSVIYFGSLIFFELEAPVNNMVPNYGAALWWAFMDATTIGSNIYPVTIVGKILAVILAGMGMMMFPLFTVYITNWVQRYNKRNAPALFNAEFTNKNSNHDNF
ncbi:MAG: potassium channel family protein [Muribaculum sp.]|nr:potassium channel family protein [Muribaculum sp.]